MSVKPEEVPLPVAQSLQQVVGALLFGANRTITINDIRACLKQVADTSEDETVKLYGQMTEREIRDVLEGIKKEFQRIGVGFELVEGSTGFRFQTQVAAGRWLRHLLKAESPARLTRPTLETLAIIAYRQPISKSEIEAIRGVAVDYIVKALMELQLVRIIGRSDLPGRPFLYGTTPSFLEHFGLKSLAELNELDPTLQRSLAAERNAKHKKPKPIKELKLETETVQAQPAEADAAPAPAEPQDERSLDELTGALASALTDTNTRIDEVIRYEETATFDGDDDEPEAEPPAPESSESSDDDAEEDETDDDDADESDEDDDGDYSDEDEEDEFDDDDEDEDEFDEEDEDDDDDENEDDDEDDR